MKDDELKVIWLFIGFLLFILIAMVVFVAISDEYFFGL
jgi:hypothetical protein